MLGSYDLWIPTHIYIDIFTYIYIYYIYIKSSNTDPSMLGIQNRWFLHQVSTLEQSKLWKPGHGRASDVCEPAERGDLKSIGLLTPGLGPNEEMRVTGST